MDEHDEKEVAELCGDGEEEERGQVKVGGSSGSRGAQHQNIAERIEQLWQWVDERVFQCLAPSYPAKAERAQAEWFVADFVKYRYICP